MARPLPIIPSPFSDYAECLNWFRCLSTSTLKAMWDHAECGPEWCDEIYRVMQERGEGNYVAV